MQEACILSRVGGRVGEFTRKVAYKGHRST
jgi:hypothetical protein